MFYICIYRYYIYRYNDITYIDGNMYLTLYSSTNILSIENGWTWQIPQWRGVEIAIHPPYLESGGPRREWTDVEARLVH